jgi:hypothetical protein
VYELLRREVRGQTDVGCVTWEPAVDQLVDHGPRARPGGQLLHVPQTDSCQGTNGHLLPSRIGYVADRGGLRNSCMAAVRRSSSSVPSGRVMTIAVLAGPSTLADGVGEDGDEVWEDISVGRGGLLDALSGVEQRRQQSFGWAC